MIAGHVGWLLRDQTTGVKTATFFLSDIGREWSAGTDNPRTYFGHLPRLHQHITLLPGSRPPGDVPAQGMGGTLTIEALVPADAAREMAVDVGDSFAAVPYWNDTAPYIHAVVTGIFTRDDPRRRVLVSQRPHIRGGDRQQLRHAAVLRDRKELLRSTRRPLPPDGQHV